MTEGENNLLNISIPIRTTPYQGDYPQIPEFEKPWETCIQFGQGNAQISKEGVPIQSEGFSKCAALIIQNLDTSEVYGAHIDDWRLNDKQYEKLETLSKGRYAARFIRGSLSRDLKDIITDRKITYFMEKFTQGRTLDVLDDIVVNSGNLHWGLVYYPKTQLLSVQVKLSHTVQDFEFLKGFSAK